MLGTASVVLVQEALVRGAEIVHQEGLEEEEAVQWEVATRAYPWGRQVACP